MYTIYYETAVIGRYETLEEAMAAYAQLVMVGLNEDKLAYSW
jgi:hypothetical protein